MATPTTQPDQRSSEMLAIVHELLRELGSSQGAESVSLHSSFERDLGLGSLERVELLLRTEKHFRCRLPDRIAQHAGTPAEWVQALAGGGETTKPGHRYRIIQPGPAPPAPASAKSFVEVFRARVETEPERVQIHLLEGHSGQDITYGKLLERSQEVAAGLIEAGLKRGETVAIMLPTCEDFFYAFFGTMLAGAIAVPIYPPAQPHKIEEYVRRQVQILRNAEVRFLISFERVKAVSQVMRLSLPTVNEITTVGALRERGAGRPEPDREPSEIFFLQYTSGSTGNPKGVTLTHGNVLANIQGIGSGVQVRPDDVVVSWLPLYHDMGLIGSWLFSVFYAFPMTVMSPLDFLSRPERWLWALTDSKGTLCPAPNFSYELCARKITDDAIEGIDLSRWRVVINAGEPVLPETLERFAKRFQPYGFRPEGYIPCYGLAESSVALTFPPLNRLPVIDTIRREPFKKEGHAVPAQPQEADVVRFVANGGPLPGHEIRVVDDNGREVGERVQGRVFFRGPSKTPGYYRNPQATAAVTSEDGWMDTGDLGYWADGEIFITGREKDAIIKGGHNIIPQEIEAAAADVSGVRRGCVSAFGILDRDTGTERLVVVAETRTRDQAELKRIQAEIIRTVDERVGIPPDQVELVPPQTIPKTSSGKIRRTETRTLYESGRLVAGKPPPWIQIVRLWTENLGGWARLGRRQAGFWAYQAYASGVVTIVGVTFGMLARLMPTHRLAAGLARSGARLALALNGHRVRARWKGVLNGREPAVFIANRAGRMDALALVATLPVSTALTGGQSVSQMPAGVAFLLEPLTAAPVDELSGPPGGTYEQRVRRALEEGQSVIVIAESALTTPADQNRFRLEPIRAAAETGTALVPVRVEGTGQILNGRRAQVQSEESHVVVGEPIRARAGDLRAATLLREQIRKAIAALGAA